MRKPKLLFALALVLSLATGLVSTAHGAGLQRTKAMDAYPCQTTTFDTYTGNSVFFIGSNSFYDLQAKLQVEVDPDRTNGAGYPYYCGYVRAGAVDQLEGNCIAFNGYATNTNLPQTTTSLWDVFHCTQTTYTFWGAISSMTCGSGNGIYAANSTDTDPGNVVYSPTYHC